MISPTLSLFLYLYLDLFFIYTLINTYITFFICFCIYIFSTLYLVGEVSDIWNEKNETDPNRLKIFSNFNCLSKVEAYE